MLRLADGRTVRRMLVYAEVDDAPSPNFPLGVELEVFVRREDAERFIADSRHARSQSQRNQ